MNDSAGATEDCLDFSSTIPVLKGAHVRHASWTPDGKKVVFEGWGGPFESDEIFMVNEDGSSLTQITNNAGTKNYDECPSVSVDGARVAVDTWNDATQHYEITMIDLQTKQRSKVGTGLTLNANADAWDPLETQYTFFWVSQQPDDSSVELYVSGFGPMRFTHNAYADYFDSSTR